MADERTQLPVSPVQHRVRCAVARSCGGCPHIESPADLVLHEKKARVLRLFTDRGISIPMMRFFEEHSPVGYRNRIRLRVFDDGTVSFFNERKSPSCAVLEDGLAHLLGSVRSRLESVRREMMGVDHLELRGFDDDGRAGLFFARQNRTGPSAPTAAFEEESEAPAAIRRALSDLPLYIGGLTAEPPVHQKFRLYKDVYHYVPLDGFMQVNHRINQAMIAWAADQATMLGVKTIVDLYCGSGNFSLPLTVDRRGVGIEANDRSVRAARRSAQEQGIACEFMTSDVGTWARTSREQFDLAVIDGPRAGMKGALSDVASLRTAHLLIFSCNPVSLAHDVARLVELGYDAWALRTFDMFAYTDHVEVGVLMARA